MNAGEFCKYNDCGWCYYNGSLDTTAEQGQCNKPTMCLVMKMEQRDKWERVKVYEKSGLEELENLREYTVKGDEE